MKLKEINLVWNTVENFDDENDLGEFIIEPIINENKEGTNLLFEKGNQIDASSKIINEFDKNVEGFDIKRSSNINTGIPKLEDLPDKNIDIRNSTFGYKQLRASNASYFEYDGKSFIDNFPPDRYSILYNKRPFLY